MVVKVDQKVMENTGGLVIYQPEVIDISLREC